MDVTIGNRLIALRNRIVNGFYVGHWEELGLLTDGTDFIDHHPRLLRSLSFQDDDYPGNALIVLRQIVEQNFRNLSIMESYVDRNFPEDSTYISAKPAERRITFSPNVFQLPDGFVELDLVAVMMPFSANLNPVIDKIRSVCKNHELTCLRADDIWENQTIIQDVFDLIYCSHIIIADFTGKNPNVFYEVGIAHTLGKLVIPLTQSISDVPFDLNHHRVLHYHPNSEGIEKMGSELETRIKSVLNKR